MKKNHLLRRAVAGLVTSVLAAGAVLSFPAVPGVKAATGGSMPAKPDYPYRNVVYYGDWSIYAGQNQFYPSMIDGSNITHLNFAFLDVDANGELVLCDYDADFTRTAIPELSGNLSGMPNAGVITSMGILRQKYPNMRIGVSVGGWTRSGDFPALASTEAGRENFASKVTEFVHNVGFDFVDIDWEYPTDYRDPDPDGNGVTTDKGCHGSEADTVNFTKLLQSLRNHLDAQSVIDGKYYELSAAMSASPRMMDKIEYKKVIDLLDFVNMMTYDLNGAWNSYTGHQTALYINEDAADFDAMPDSVFSIDTAVRQLKSYGLTNTQMKKVVIGVAAYTRGWSKAQGGGKDPQNPYLYAPATPDVIGEDGKVANGCFGYTKFMSEKASSLTYHFDDKAKAAYYTDGNYFYTLDTPQSIGYKGQYVKDQGLGGLIMWMASQDRDGILTKAMKESMYGSSKITDRSNPNAEIVFPYPNVTADVIANGNSYQIMLTNNETMTYTEKPSPKIDESPNASYYAELFGKTPFNAKLYITTKSGATLSAGEGCKSGSDSRGQYFALEGQWYGAWIEPGKSYTFTVKCSGEADDEDITGIYMTERLTPSTSDIRGREVFDPEALAASKIHVNLPEWTSGGSYSIGDMTAIGKHVYEAIGANGGVYKPGTENGLIWKLLPNYINDGEIVTTPTPGPTQDPNNTPTPTNKPARVNGSVWAPSGTYNPGDIVIYNGKVYECTRTIPGQAGWDPVTLLGSYWKERTDLTPADVNTGDDPDPTPTVKPNTPTPTEKPNTPTPTKAPTVTPTTKPSDNGWKRVSGSWYYYKNGKVSTGWLKDAGQWYYLNPAKNGAMAKGWLKVDGKWYFFGTDGIMKTGLVNDGGVIYVCKSSGDLVINKWAEVNGAWYHTDSQGVMQTNVWIKSSGKWYYFDANGKMVSNCTIKIDGVNYTFDANGAWVK